MRFLKENSYDIIKLFINQIGISIFSLMLYTSINLIDLNNYKTQIYVGISIFSILFYFVLLYTASWEFGAKDRIRVDGGRLSVPKFKGGLMSVFANIPNFIISGLALIFISLYLLGGSEVFYTAFALFNLPLRLIMSIYLGLIMGIFSFASGNIAFLLETIGYFVIPVFAIVVTQLGYSLGYKEFRISSLFNGTNIKK